jgi:hypothetical protein
VSSNKPATANDEMIRYQEPTSSLDANNRLCLNFVAGSRSFSNEQSVQPKIGLVFQRILLSQARDADAI